MFSAGCFAETGSLAGRALFLTPGSAFHGDIKIA